MIKTYLNKGAAMNFGLKITFIVVLTFSVLFMVLSNMGGDEPVYKNVVEEFIGKSLGGYSQVGTLHNMRFFPEIIVDIEDVKFKRGVPQVTEDETPEPIVNPDLLIDRIQLSMGFFDIMFSTKKISVFNIQNVQANAGVLSRKAVSFDRIGIVTPREKGQDAEPYFSFDGDYGGDKLSLSADMVSAGAKYKFHPGRKFEFQYSDLIMTGALFHSGARMLDIENLEISNPQKAAEGHLKFKVKGDKEAFQVSGGLNIISQKLFLEALSTMYDLTNGFAGHKPPFRQYQIDIDFENPDIEAMNTVLRVEADTISVTDETAASIDPFHWGVLRTAIGADDNAACCEVLR
jgi:hypothetical protein